MLLGEAFLARISHQRELLASDFVALKGQQGTAGGNAPGTRCKWQTDPEGVGQVLRGNSLSPHPELLVRNPG